MNVLIVCVIKKLAWKMVYKSVIKYLFYFASQYSQSIKYFFIKVFQRDCFLGNNFLVFEK